jgi:hypothetical protein
MFSNRVSGCQAMNCMRRGKNSQSQWRVLLFLSDRTWRSKQNEDGRDEKQADFSAWDSLSPWCRGRLDPDLLLRHKRLRYFIGILQPEFSPESSDRGQQEMRTDAAKASNSMTWRALNGAVAKPNSN